MREQRYTSNRPDASPALLVKLRPVRVFLLCDDLAEQQKLEPLVALIEAVLRSELVKGVAS